MNIFISHSITDKELIENIQQTLVPYGLKFFIAEHTRNHEVNITEKIEQLIQKSHVGLVLLTENGYNSHFVQQEIGYLKSLKKPFIQVIQVGFEGKIKGFNYGKDFILLDLNKTNEAIHLIKEDLLKFYNKFTKQKELARKKRLVQQQQQKDILEQKNRLEKQKREANIAFGVLASLLVLGVISGK